MNSLTPSQWLEVVRSQANRIETLEQRLAWFERQIFGSKSERLSVLENAQQLPLAAMSSGETPATTAKLRTVSEYTRRVQQKDEVGAADSVPFFDETRVPVETITVLNPHTQGLAPDQYEVISEKVTYRLAQRPGSYVMLKYVREVIKLKQTQAIHCPPAPVGVLEGSRADVSFLAGLLLEKFTYYAPLYRQHQRLQDNGIRVTRPWLTQLTQQSIGLLEPVYAAQLDSVRVSRVIAMDETPIKAGRSGHGKMKTGYFWPIYGEQDEVCFPFFPLARQRARAHRAGITRPRSGATHGRLCRVREICAQAGDCPRSVLGSLSTDLLRGAAGGSGGHRGSSKTDRRVVQNRRSDPRAEAHWGEETSTPADP